MESSHRKIVHQSAAWLLSQPHTQVVGFEIRYGHSVLDVVGVSAKRNCQRISIVECKATRSDLLQDLKKGKLLKYQGQSTHCYLAATVEALRADKLSTTEILTDLTNRGLPAHWGVLLVTDQVVSLRAAKSHRSTTFNQLQAISLKISKANCYRLFTNLGIIQPYA